MELLGSNGVPAGAIRDLREIRDDEEMQRRGVIVTVDHPERGPFTMPGWPVRMSESKVAVTASPLLGAHSSQIYGDWLGLDEAEIAKLRDDGVI